VLALNLEEFTPGGPLLTFQGCRNEIAQHLYLEDRGVLRQQNPNLCDPVTYLGERRGHFPGHADVRSRKESRLFQDKEVLRSVCEGWVRLYLDRYMLVSAR
jgi:hypothetical protein